MKSADAISADSLVMLLSTDWFFEYWPAIGIGVAKAKKTALQNGCRSIVKQILVEGGEEAKENFNVSFDASRAMRIGELFMELLAKSELDCCATSTIHAALGQNKYSAKTLETLEDVTRMQLQNMLNGVPPKLEPSVKQTIHKAWKQKQTLTEGWQPIDHLDFGHLNLASSSHWDQEMRGLTPDIEKIVSALEYIWCLASEDFNSEQKKELIGWYCAITENLTGTVLKLPCLSLTMADVP